MNAVVDVTEQEWLNEPREASIPWKKWEPIERAAVRYGAGGRMTLDPPTSGDRPPQEPFDFSLVLGGPLFQLLRLAHLSDDALTLVKKRILAFLLLTWLPLLGLSALGGQMLNGSTAVSLVTDLVHVRFLVAMPSKWA